MGRRIPELRVGTSGYQYEHWKGIFYPEALPTKAWLRFYAGRFDTVEINDTFYHLPSEKSFDRWRARIEDLVSASCFHRDLQT